MENEDVKLTITLGTEADARCIASIDALPGCFAYSEYEQSGEEAEAHAVRAVKALALRVFIDRLEHPGCHLESIRFEVAR